MEQDSLSETQNSCDQKAALSSVTAYFNLNTGNIRIMSDETETASEIPSGPICLNAYLNLLQIGKEDEERVRGSLSVEAIRRKLEEADSFKLRFPSEVAENKFEWNEMRERCFTTSFWSMSMSDTGEGSRTSYSVTGRWEAEAEPGYPS